MDPATPHPRSTVTLQVTTRARVRNPFDPLEDERWPVRTMASYVHPFGNDRNDLPDRLVPQGNLMGLATSALIPIGEVRLAPSVQLLRETGHATAATQFVRAQLDSRAWSSHLGLDLLVPIGDHLTLTPRAGYAFGNVGETTSAQITTRQGGRAGTRGFDSTIHGSWLGLEVALVR